jgi:hypothetical protein
MARNFDGTNDNLSSADNAIAALNSAQKSISLWTTRASDSSAAQCLVTPMAQAGAGQGRHPVNAIPPTTSGWMLSQLLSATTIGRWQSPDITNTRHHVAVVFDRSSLLNDPVMYVDGVSVTVTETVAPVGTISTGEDTLRMGENAGGGDDLAANEQHVCIDMQLWVANQVNRAMWWGRAQGGLLVYHPLITDKLADEGSAAETLTANGTTVTELSTPVVRPGHALMGLGIGW